MCGGDGSGGEISKSKLASSGQGDAEMPHHHDDTAASSSSVEALAPGAEPFPAQDPRAVLAYCGGETAALEREDVQSGRIEEVGPGLVLPPKGDEDGTPWNEVRESKASLCTLGRRIKWASWGRLGSLLEHHGRG